MSAGLQRQERLRIQAAEDTLHAKRQAAAEVEMRAAEVAQQHQALALVTFKPDWGFMASFATPKHCLFP